MTTIQDNKVDRKYSEGYKLKVIVLKTLGNKKMWCVYCMTSIPLAKCKNKSAEDEDLYNTKELLISKIVYTSPF